MDLICRILKFVRTSDHFLFHSIDSGLYQIHKTYTITDPKDDTHNCLTAQPFMFNHTIPSDPSRTLRVSVGLMLVLESSDAIVDITLIYGTT